MPEKPNLESETSSNATNKAWKELLLETHAIKTAKHASMEAVIILPFTDLKKLLICIYSRFCLMS